MGHTIHWRNWCAAALSEAAAEHKPILLSLVTAWSEECAAMDEATYLRPEVVAAAESRFVPIRVDADRRPDLNERYNLGGWPTTALLTPDGHVLSGATYLGPDELLALMTQAADAWRDRKEEILRRAGLATRHDQRETRPTYLKPDTTAVSWFRALLIDQFDVEHGGFGTGPKSPHVPAMQFAVAVVAEESHAGTEAGRALREIVEVTLARIDTLWDPARGGFYRYADGRDWSRPATEKTLDDNAAVLALLLDAAVQLDSEPCRERAADLIRWVKQVLGPPDPLAPLDNDAGGFFNSVAAVSQVVDRAKYADRNADMIAGFLRASALFDDPWLRDFALKSLEVVVVPGYVPGQGVAHVGRVLSDPAAGPKEPAARDEVRGLLTDQVRVTAALVWAHLATGQLPYSMLAAEVMQFAIRTMWDETASCFRDRVEPDAPLWPFALNCEAACVLDRLASMTGDAAYHDRAVAILATLAPEYRRHGIFAAPYALAIREVVERRGPPGLKLSHVDWHLDKD